MERTYDQWLLVMQKEGLIDKGYLQYDYEEDILSDKLIARECAAYIYYGSLIINKDKNNWN